MASSNVTMDSLFATVGVLVVGDVMLDRYWFGNVSRISPEAPVPVVKVEHLEERPGGAANVARNVAALGAHVELLSVVGDDEAGGRLEQLLKREGVSARMHRDPLLATTIKLRVIGRQQQLLRIDFEKEPSAAALATKLDDFCRLLPEANAVILSDYGKGSLLHVQSMIQRARQEGKPVIVDPKGDDYSQYKGATILTPNRAELREVVGRWRDEADLEHRAQELRSSLGISALLVTRSEEGMSLFQETGAVHVPAQAREVFDVTGAGDTVVAVLGTLVAAKTDLREAARLANLAGGIVVGKLGAAVVSAQELFGEVGS
jgi:rfaE bifunctional protein kinase chain/domain